MYKVFEVAEIQFVKMVVFTCESFSSLTKKSRKNYLVTIIRQLQHYWLLYAFPLIKSFLLQLINFNCVTFRKVIVIKTQTTAKVNSYFKFQKTYTGELNIILFHKSLAIWTQQSAG